MDLLSKSGLGSQLLGVFNNGICYQYLPGHPITRDMVSSKHNEIGKHAFDQNGTEDKYFVGQNEKVH